MSAVIEHTTTVTATVTAAAAAAAGVAGAGPLAPLSTNSTTASGFVPAFQGWAGTFATDASAVLLSLDNAAVDVGKAAVIFLIIAGALLWFGRVNRRLGKDLVEGGILVAIFITFVVPFLMTLHY
jgi:hypothetical protein